MTIVDLYCRVSTTEQATEGYSLGEQETRLRKYAEAQNWAINGCYSDGGYSGSNLQRPGIQSVIKDAKEHKISKVIVLKLDRLSRSQKDTLELIEDVFIANGVDFVSMTETLDTGTPLGIAMIGILSAFAQLERSQITERMMLGRTARAKLGYWHGGGPAPIGYDYDPTDEQLHINGDAHIVQQVFSEYLAGGTFSGIATELNRSEFRDRGWQPSHISRMLTNEIYAGFYVWQGQRIPMNKDHPCIVSKDIFERVQTEYKRRCGGATEKHDTPYKHVYLLGGLLWCGKCGQRYVMDGKAKQGPPGYWLYCINRKRYKTYHREKCESKLLRSNEIEDIVIAEIKKLTADRSMVASDQAQAKATQEEIKSIKKRLSEIDTQYDRLIDLYSLGKVDASAIGKRLDALDTERDTLKERLNVLKTALESDTAGALNKSLDEFDALINSVSDRMELYGVVHQLIQSITIDGDDIQIHWNL